jgi:hypothetical protein
MRPHQLQMIAWYRASVWAVDPGDVLKLMIRNESLPRDYFLSKRPGPCINQSLNLK